MGAELLFFKNTLEKLDLEIQVVRGKNNDFKSAVEPFFRDQMSDSSRLQIQKYLSSMWLDIREDISKDRNIEMQQLNKLAENVTIRKLSDAVKYHLIDAVKYKDEVIDLLKKKVNISGNDDLKLIAFEKYSNKSFLKSQLINKLEDPNIAVIVAEGEISVDGDGMTSKKIVQLFQDVRKNKTIKTVVFRINSPGGSALASEEIWREVKLTNAIKKVIVSMGNVAASGGYYVASPATKIFAEPTTITGSIGVFGVVPYTGDFFKNKLGLTFDRVSTNKHSIVSLNRKLTSEEINLIQSEIDEIYMQFMMKVSAGRRMSIDQVNKIARGRVWTGRDALKIGLVDNLGGITDAVNYAAKISNISEQKVLFYPLQEEDPIAELIEKFEDQDALTTSESKIPSSIINYYNQLKKIESLQGVQMRLPFEIDIK